jgi:hypothetical protein
MSSRGVATWQIRFAVRLLTHLGVLMQGDSLHILRGDLAEVVEACERGDLAQARDSAGLLLAGLDTPLTRYTDALQEHEISRPY